MLSLCRGLVAALLLAGLAALCMDPANVGAQDKKDPKGKTAKEEVAERGVSVPTSDGLALKGYWFQGTALDKNRPDAVMMMPAPGNKINEQWIWLAKALSEKNFSVLLFDWRGCGLNGTAANGGSGVGILDDRTKFWNEPYNGMLLMKSKALIEKNGIDYKAVSAAPDVRGARYRDFMFMNDLQGARFYLDKQNDDGKCNTNRIWIISEKDGSHLGLAFVAAEFQRHTKYFPGGNLFDIKEKIVPAGKDYVGMMALSYSTSGFASPSASKIFSNALPTLGANDLVKDARDHLKDRMAMVLMSKKGDGGPSRALLNTVGVSATVEATLRDLYKYPKEFDIKAMKPISGIDLIPVDDSFKVKEYVIEAMVAISKKSPTGKGTPSDRDASKTFTAPRFPIEKFNK
ncbi:MAG: hypothetical protein EXS09_16955 [Gemmataceae bacterium]|nr:hypothetical protein [Gemmataceae bacterium]